MSGSMNGRMARVFTLLSVGFGGIVLLLSWWQVATAGDLKQRDENNQTAYYEQRVQRGFIGTVDGVRLAGRGASKGANGDTIWRRRYPQGSLAAHVLGYDTRGRSRSGVERALNDVLTGSTRDLGAVVGLLDGDEQAIGDDVTLTIDAKAQRIAEQALAAGGYRGAIVALTPKTGEIQVMASSPTFAPGDVENDFTRILERRDSPLLNRATQARYAPGSTFKLVTAAAALESGVEPDRTFPGGCGADLPGSPIIRNYGNSCTRPHDLTYALTNSVNQSFAELGHELGQSTMREQMERFGFYSTPPVEGLPGNEVRESGLSGTDGRPLPADEPVDVGREAIGQERLTVTPLQMAMVAGGIANGGTVMEPSVISRVTRGTEGAASDGAVLERHEPKVWKEAMSAGNAAALTRMMEEVVNIGSGSAAQLRDIDVAGKTGTAETTGSGNLVWFVAFAPAGNPEYAIAVALEGQASGSTGGGLAAPIAKQVLESLLARGAT
ncbi:MAG: Peptidoglycan glycosyltransferase [Thermoleophilia bacterium]|jgi:peptidoglycan glycosyltransferase|nr:Peptidoglycan glycosyltransferase [Thermoleophilia bacterium]